MKLRFRKNESYLFGFLIYAEDALEFGIELYLFKWTIAWERSL